MNGITYKPELDGIRAVAVLSVLAFHTQLTWFGGMRADGGLLGVDLFFVLSGFLITSLLLDEYKVTGGIRRRHFYARRALRLLPALGLAVVVGAFVTHRYGNGFGTMTYPRAVLATVFFSGNWFGNKLGVLTPMWSLGLEEQYYLIWPFILLAALRRGIRPARLAAVSGLAALTIAVMRSVISHALWTNTRWLEFALHGWGRGDGVLLGSALALVLYSARTNYVRAALRDRSLGFAAVVCAIGVCVHAALLNVVTYDSIFLLDICFALAIGHVFADPAGPIGRVLGTQPLAAVGKISYGLYIFHWPIFFYARHAFVTPALGVAAAWLMTFGLAVASFVAVERPALRLNAKLGVARRAAVPLRRHRPAARRPRRRPVRPSSRLAGATSPS